MADPADDPGQGAPRRRFLARVSTSLGALFGAATLVGPLGLLLDPLVRRRGARGQEAERWTPVAATDRFPAGGEPVRVVLSEDRRDAWVVRPDMPVGPVLVERVAADDFRVLSGICPHLGCSVNVAGDRFLCPCHRSSFGRDGALLLHPDGKANPAPRGLDPLAWRVRNGQLEVRWVRYMPGLEERVEA